MDKYMMSIDSASNNNNNQQTFNNNKREREKPERKIVCVFSFFSMGKIQTIDQYRVTVRMSQTVM